MENKKTFDKNINWTVVLGPLLLCGIIAIWILFFPTSSTNVIMAVREFIVDKLGAGYMLMGLGVLGVCMYLAFSRHGKVRLGESKPKYSTFAWAAMIFTATMSSDTLIWSLMEWTNYMEITPFGQPMNTAAQQDWASAYPMFHWGPTVWAIYILPAAAYAVMMYKRKAAKQSLSEACRPVLGKYTDKLPGKAIDVVAITGLFLASASSFCFAVPVMSKIVSRFTGIPDSGVMSALILIGIAIVFTLATLKGMKAISRLAQGCVYVYLAVLAIFFIFGDQVYILESGLSSIGKIMDNFFGMSTWMDPLRITGEGTAAFPQTWTVFYWAYWIACFVGSPIFIAKISEGRSLKQLILGGIGLGTAGCFTSFIITSNYGLSQQMNGAIDVQAIYAAGGTPADAILAIVDTLPIGEIAMVLMVVTMVLLAASCIDAYSIIFGEYSMNKVTGEEPSNKMKVYWCALFLLLPLVFLFNESTLGTMQAVVIVAALPLAIILIIMVISMFKTLRQTEPARVEETIKHPAAIEAEPNGTPAAK